LCKSRAEKKHGKNAENRYGQAFGTFECHYVLKFAAKIRGEKSKQ